MFATFQATSSADDPRSTAALVVEKYDALVKSEGPG